MPLAAAITDLEQLKERPPVRHLLEWNPQAVTAAKWDRDELTIWIERSLIREAAQSLRDDRRLQFIACTDVTCVDWYPSEPRFEVVYHLLSIVNKQRVRLKVRLSGDDAVVESLMPLWPGVNYFEREIYDLFGVRFVGHPDLRRIQMPEDWKGHPLRKDYPVEGYR
jgi:NADH-quinone oxidoreductase subunit C